MLGLFTQLVITLLIAHIFGDFLLQSHRDAEKKQYKISILVKHSLIVACVSYLLAGLWNVWTIPVVIFFTHAAIDYIKSFLYNNGLKGLIIDQALHVFIIFILVLFVYSSNQDVNIYWIQVFGPVFFQTLIPAAGFALTVFGGNVVVSIAVNPYVEQLNQNIFHTEEYNKIAPGLQKGGKIIGQLERALIFLFVALGTYEALGFLIAAKIIFLIAVRQERGQRMHAEYIMIGTLWSFVFAILSSLATFQAIDLLKL